MPKPKKVQCRVPEDLRDAFDRALELTGMGETQFVEACLKAFIEYVREHQEITLPLAIIPKSEAKKPVPAAPAVRPSTPTTEHGLNEEPPRTTSTRAALRGMVERETHHGKGSK